MSRQYIRHPSDIPIEFRAEHWDGHISEQMTNISAGGLAFDTTACVKPGTILDIRIPVHSSPFEARGRVIWCSPTERDGVFTLGVEFLGEHTDYRVRMIEQVCQIEHYKRQTMEKEGRILTGQEAAAEWIAKYAGQFPHIGESSAE